MDVQVDLFYRIRDLAPERFRNGPVRVELSAGARVSALLALLELPESTPMILLVEGRARQPDAELRDGQTVTIFPPLDGG